MIGRLEGARTGGTAARVAALVAAIDFLSHLHLGFRDLLGPRQALPQRWQLLRLVQGEVEDLAGEDILKPALGENMLTPGMAGAVIAAVQRFLETTPAPLRAWADAELLKGPTMPVSRRLQAACRNMVRNQLKQPGARIAAMVRLREPAGALHVQPTQALAADNLQFIAGLWLYIPSREHLEFLAFLKPLLAPAPMALRELLAQEIMLAGQKKLAMEFEALSAEEQRRSWPVLSQQIEAQTFDAIVQVLAGSPAGP
ncbi:hypothetical protein GT347_18705 [Xylophilus rhododendri]|uniref:Uncharacterized protein n=2 Tax=Xylophilus rhododendri TaxID=2697032 RepID=A0A857J9P7_9BURK|nr:hypothetical protein GT347_18705 [Xylophilus rhododendri]